MNRFHHLQIQSLQIEEARLRHCLNDATRTWLVFLCCDVEAEIDEMRSPLNKTLKIMRTTLWNICRSQGLERDGELPASSVSKGGLPVV